MVAETGYSGDFAIGGPWPIAASRVPFLESPFAAVFFGQRHELGPDTAVAPRSTIERTGSMVMPSRCAIERFRASQWSCGDRSRPTQRRPRLCGRSSDTQGALRSSPLCMANTTQLIRGVFERIRVSGGAAGLLSSVRCSHSSRTRPRVLRQRHCFRRQLRNDLCCASVTILGEKRTASAKTWRLAERFIH